MAASTAAMATVTLAVTSTDDSSTAFSTPMTAAAAMPVPRAMAESLRPRLTLVEMRVGSCHDAVTADDMLHSQGSRDSVNMPRVRRSWTGTGVWGCGYRGEGSDSASGGERVVSVNGGPSDTTRLILIASGHPQLNIESTVLLTTHLKGHSTQ